MTYDHLTFFHLFTFDVKCNKMLILFHSDDFTLLVPCFIIIVIYKRQKKMCSYVLIHRKHQLPQPGTINRHHGCHKTNKMNGERAQIVGGVMMDSLFGDLVILSWILLETRKLFEKIYDSFCFMIDEINIKTLGYDYFYFNNLRMFFCT